MLFRASIWCWSLIEQLADEDEEDEGDRDGDTVLSDCSDELESSDSLMPRESSSNLLIRERNVWLALRCLLFCFSRIKFKIG